MTDKLLMSIMPQAISCLFQVGMLCISVEQIHDSEAEWRKGLESIRKTLELFGRRWRIGRM